MNDHDARDLLAQGRAEAEGIGSEWKLPVEIDLLSAMCLVGNLQLALRHPNNHGHSAQVAREFIDGVIERMEQCGLVVTARIMRLGDDPACDDLKAGQDAAT